MKKIKRGEGKNYVFNPSRQGALEACPSCGDLLPGWDCCGRCDVEVDQDYLIKHRKGLSKQSNTKER